MMTGLFRISSWQAGLAVLLLLSAVSARATRVSGNSDYGSGSFTSISPTGETPVTGITEGEFEATSDDTEFVYYFDIGDLSNFELLITGPTSDLVDYGVLGCTLASSNEPCTTDPSAFNVATALNGVIDADPSGPPPTTFNTSFDVTGSGDGLVLFVAETNGTTTSPPVPEVFEQPLSTPEPRSLSLMVGGLFLLAVSVFRQRLRRFSSATR